MGAVAAVSDTIAHVGEVVSNDIITPVVDTVSDIVSDPKALAVVALSVAAPGVGTAIGTALGAEGLAATVIGNAVVGGTISAATGGDPVQGALTAGAGSLLGSVIAPEITEITGSPTASQAITSGIISEAQGGDFLKGATTGAVTGGLTQAQNALAEEYLQSLPGGHGGYNEATAPTEADVIQAISPTPDQAVAAQPSDQMQILYDQYVQMGMSGEEALNQVISDMGPEFTSEIGPYQQTPPIAQEQQPLQGADISKELAALDVAKALAPIAIGAVINEIATPSGTNTSPYQLVPVPSNWMPPPQQQQFLPSAPIDFGSPELLRGTQWEKYINPSINNVISTIQAPYQSYANQVIGNLNNVPVSINDIISGITSGQTNAG
jgi:hypothetical protein